MKEANSHPSVPNGTVWTHRKKLTSYVVLSCGNLYSDDQEKFPTQIAYMDMQGRLWFRKPSVFLDKFIRD